MGENEIKIEKVEKFKCGCKRALHLLQISPRKDPGNCYHYTRYHLNNSIDMDIQIYNIHYSSVMYVFILSQDSVI